jgi:hypothetical protein
MSLEDIKDEDFYITKSIISISIAYYCVKDNINYSLEDFFGSRENLNNYIILKTL